MPSVELGLAVITDPVDRLLITMPGYTPGLGFQQFTFFELSHVDSINEKSVAHKIMPS